jgi:hypothetical protein
VLAVPASGAGGLVLHPSGFGEHSYSAWKAHQGLPDTKGNDDQALYFQKMTPTTTFAAGLAVVKGLEGMPANQLDGLGWDHRVDGHCGAGAPRWTLFLRNAMGQNRTVFLGCFAAAHAPTPGAETTWCRDTYSSSAIDAEILAQAGAASSTFTIRAIAIHFDEGPEVMLPEPVACPQAAPQGGFVYLDNITVEANGAVHVWTGASDNGNGQTIVQSTESPESLLGLPFESLLGSS